jgi:Mn2+/Fe2+ NRAMP family transporter
MADTSGNADTTGSPATGSTGATGETHPGPRKSSWKYIGPGIVVAATGVGAGDLVATLIAGSNFGYTLLWAAVIGCLVKISLAEAAGRWHLSTGRTLFDGWASLGRWTSWFFVAYVVIWGFVYGAAAMSSSGLPLQALFPDVMGLKSWAILTGLVGLVFVWFNKYAVFEKVMTVLVGVMFVVTVYLAIRVTPNLADAFAGLLPVLPDEKDSILNTLGLIGGVGGTITLAAYGYWVNAKGWTNTGWMKVMRLDNRVAYITTGIFVISMLFVGAELLHSSNVAIASGDKGLIQLGDILEDEYGTATAKFFLIGFFATSFTSLIGVWHGVSLMFADFVERYRKDRAATGSSDGKDTDGHQRGLGRGGGVRHPREVLAVPRVPALADLPAHDPALPGPALPPDHPVRSPGRGLPPLPRPHPGLAPQLLPHARGMAQRNPEQRHADDRRPALRRPVREADLGPAVVGVLLAGVLLDGRLRGSPATSHWSRCS